MGYELKGWGSISGRGKLFFSIPQRQDGSVSHPAPSPVERGGSSHDGKQPELEADDLPVPRSEMVETDIKFPIRLHGIVLN
jgi:hypothetical protein